MATSYDLYRAQLAAYTKIRRTSQDKHQREEHSTSSVFSELYEVAADADALLQELQRLRLIMLGRNGIGKSTLLNYSVMLASVRYKRVPSLCLARACPACV